MPTPIPSDLVHAHPYKDHGLVFVTLWSANATLLFPAKTGVIYENQVGGTNCLCLGLEGFCVPLYADVEIPSWQVVGAARDLCALFPGGSPGTLSAAQVSAIDTILAPFAVSVDRARLRESWEAWLFVTVHSTEHLEVRGLKGPLAAILTWPNSD